MLGCLLSLHCSDFIAGAMAKLYPFWFFILDTTILNAVLTISTWLHSGGVQTRNVQFIASEPGLLDHQVIMHFGDPQFSCG